MSGRRRPCSLPLASASLHRLKHVLAYPSAFLGTLSHPFAGSRTLGADTWQVSDLFGGLAAALSANCEFSFTLTSPRDVLKRTCR
eukprot:scaffold2752_cov393-Prasinococcus_capsulatus_cf.AAC.2